MIKGFVSRRTTQRVPYEAEIGIQFTCGDNTAITANTTNLSPEGVRFFVPKGHIKLAPEEIIELSFNLPNKEAFTVQGEICYFSQAMDNNEKPVVYYGVRFINLTAEISEAIREFCQMQLTDETDEPEMQQNTDTSSILVNDVFDPETMDSSEFDIPQDIQKAFQGEPATTAKPQPAAFSADIPVASQPDLSDNLLTSKNETSYRSLSQEMIDQIIRSMTSSRASAAPASEVVTSETDSKNEAIPNQHTKETPEIHTSSAVEQKESQTEKQHNLIEQFRKIAESLNIKIDEELFEKISIPDNKPNETLPSSQPEPVSHTEAGHGLTASSFNPDHSFESTDNFDVSHHQETPGSGQMNIDNLLFSNSSLLDILYGNEGDTATPSAPPVQPESAKTIIPSNPEPKVSRTDSNHPGQKNEPESILAKPVSEFIQSKVSPEPETPHSNHQIPVSGLGPLNTQDEKTQ